MMNLIHERNKTLAEMLGFCWHRYKGVVVNGKQWQVCIDCGYIVPHGDAAETYPDFSNGMWFTILHSHVKQNIKYIDFFRSDYNPYMSGAVVTPDSFADSLYYYLVSEEMKAYFDERNKDCGAGGDSLAGNEERLVGYTPANP